MRTWAWILLAGSAMLGGCVKPEFSHQTYETICVGASQQDVLRVMGPPQTQDANSWIYAHEVPFYKAVIRFDNGLVTSKGWTNDRTVEPKAETRPMIRTGIDLKRR